MCVCVLDVQGWRVLTVVVVVLRGGDSARRSRYKFSGGAY